MGADASIPGDGARHSRREFLQRSATGAAALGVGGFAARHGLPTSIRPRATREELASERPESSTPKRGGTLRAAISGGAASDTISPLSPTLTTDFARVLNLYDPLVRFTPEAGMELALAEEIEPNKDATEWTIRVRDGVTFHNGKPLTAEDVIYTFRTIINPKSPGAGASSLTRLDLRSMKVVDRRTAKFPCTAPFSTFSEVLPNYYFNIIPVGFDPHHPVGTGPFRYQEFTPGVSSRFLRFDDYWMTGLPYLDEMIVEDYAEEDSQVDALVSGAADVINQLTFPSISSVESGGAEVLVSNGGGFTPFTMRVDLEPFRDPRVRKAFALIVDRDQMRQLLFDKYGLIGNDLYALWDPVYDHSIPQAHQDIEQAKHLLKAAGHEHLTITLVTAPMYQGVTGAAEIFAEQAASAGIKVNVDLVTVTVQSGPNYLKWLFSQDYWFYNSFYPQVAQATLPTAPFNETHYDDAHFNDLYNAALATTDVNRKTLLAHDMQQVMYEKNGYIIPYFPAVIDGYSSKVRGLVKNKTGVSLNSFGFKYLWFE